MRAHFPSLARTTLREIFTAWLHKEEMAQQKDSEFFIPALAINWLCVPGDLHRIPRLSEAPWEVP